MALSILASCVLYALPKTKTCLNLGIRRFIKISKRCWGFKGAAVIPSRPPCNSDLDDTAEIQVGEIQVLSRRFKYGTASSAQILRFLFTTRDNDLHLLGLTSNPPAHNNSEHFLTEVCNPVLVSPTSTRSSANANIETLASGERRTPIPNRGISEESSSITRLNKHGESGSPCLTPRLIPTGADISPPTLKVVVELQYP